MLFRSILLAAVLAGSSFGQAPPRQTELNSAYKAVADKDYDSAIDLFRQGLAKQPANAAAHKDLAYTLLRAGENAAGSMCATIGSGASPSRTAAASFAAAGEVWIPNPPWPAHQKKPGTRMSNP